MSPIPPGLPQDAASALLFPRVWQKNEVKNSLHGMAGQTEVSKGMRLMGTVPSLPDPERWSLWREASGAGSPLPASTQHPARCPPPRFHRNANAGLPDLACPRRPKPQASLATSFRARTSHWPGAAFPRPAVTLGTARTLAPHVAMGASTGSVWGEVGVVHHHRRGEGALSPLSAPWEGTSPSSEISPEVGERAGPRAAVGSGIPGEELDLGEG